MRASHHRQRGWNIFDDWIRSHCAYYRAAKRSGPIFGRTPSLQNDGQVTAQPQALSMPGILAVLRHQTFMQKPGYLASLPALKPDDAHLDLPLGGMIEAVYSPGFVSRVKKVSGADEDTTTTPEKHDDNICEATGKNRIARPVKQTRCVLS